MRNITHYFANKLLLDAIVSQPCYVGLLADLETEVDKPSYSRQPVSFYPPTNSQTANDGLIQFPVAVEAWGRIAYVGVYDAMEDGNLLTVAEPPIVHDVQPSGDYQIRPNTLVLRFE